MAETMPRISKIYGKESHRKLKKCRQAAINRGNSFCQHHNYANKNVRNFRIVTNHSLLNKQADSTSSTQQDRP